MVDWYVEGIAFGSCNCDYGCPCQFEQRPTHGDCRGFEVARIDKGHFDAVSLDGLHIAIFYAWPRAIFEGGGTMQAVIDERADERQRHALATILHGGETAEKRRRPRPIGGSTMPCRARSLIRSSLPSNSKSKSTSAELE